MAKTMAILFSLNTGISLSKLENNQLIVESFSNDSAEKPTLTELKPIFFMSIISSEVMKWSIIFFENPSYALGPRISFRFFLAVS